MQYNISKNKQEQTKVTALHLTVGKTIKVMPSWKLRHLQESYIDSMSHGHLVRTEYYKIEHFTLIIGSKINNSLNCIQSYLL